MDSRYRTMVDPTKRQGGLEMVELDGITFHINPDTFQEQTQRVQYVAPTRAGSVRFSYGVQPVVYTLEGFTGNAGVAHLRALERFRPLVGRQDRQISFKFPSRFREVRYVYVNRFDDSISSDMHLYNKYSIELVELGGKQAPATVARLANDAQSALQITLLPGGGGQIVSAPSSGAKGKG